MASRRTTAVRPRKDRLHHSAPVLVWLAPARRVPERMDAMTDPRQIIAKAVSTHYEYCDDPRPEHCLKCIYALALGGSALAALSAAGWTLVHDATEEWGFKKGTRREVEPMAESAARARADALALVYPHPEVIRRVVSPWEPAPEATNG